MSTIVERSTVTEECYGWRCLLHRLVTPLAGFLVYRKREC